MRNRATLYDVAAMGGIVRRIDDFWLKNLDAIPEIARYRKSSCEIAIHTIFSHVPTRTAFSRYCAILVRSTMVSTSRQIITSRSILIVVFERKMPNV